MKVSRTGSSSAAAGGARRVDKSTGNAGQFKQALVDALDGSAGPHAAEAPTQLAGIDALLLVQSVDDSTERQARKRLLRRGEDILDKLEEVRHGLLLGTVPKEKLMDLAQMVRSRREACQDPRLGALLDEIELRAEVEIAKLSKGL
ncbi:MAG TPA: flagellar assembly protein FliX, partial [Magnetospirillum sp.]|nr:flagellar assembly protein FliX [Magnetospirillum sp.]